MIYDKISNYAFDLFFVENIYKNASFSKKSWRVQEKWPSIGLFIHEIDHFLLSSKNFIHF